jgi:hypothetical protein
MNTLYVQIENRIFWVQTVCETPVSYLGIYYPGGKAMKRGTLRL